jgi:hypothetical protein
MRKLFALVVAGALALAPLASLAQAPATQPQVNAGGTAVVTQNQPAVVVAPPAAGPTSDGKVTIEYGGWVSKALDFVYPILIAVIVWLFRQLPAQVVSILEMLRVEQLIARAVDYGINTVKGATKDKKLEIPVANQVIEAAADYAAAQASTLVERFGGLEALKQKILARLTVVEGADAKVLNVAEPPPAKVSVGSA